MRALIFDTETTGLVGNSLLNTDQQPRILEFFGHIVERDGTVLEELEFMCNPGVPVTSEITRITGIKSEDVKGLPGFREYAPQLARLLGKAEAMVAHNLAFDYAVTRYEFERLNIHVQWPLVRICTVAETEWMLGRRMKLIELHEALFGEPFTGAHRARTDVEALTRCYVELCARREL
jgi:DNA polymerase III epsilon subunit-like protein